MSGLDDILEFGRELVMRVYRQLERSWNELNSKMLTRIGLIIAIYFLVRPYFVKFIEWTHMKSEKKAKRSKGAKAKISPNSLRAGAADEEEEDDDSDDSGGEVEQAQSTGTVLNEDQLDKLARKRQRRLDRARENAEELQKFAEKEWEDPDIADLIVGRP